MDDVKYVITGMPAPDALESSDEYLLQVVQVTGEGDDVSVHLMTVPEPDPVVTARRAYANATRDINRDESLLAVASAMALVADSVNRLNVNLGKKLDRVAIALRNKDGEDPF